MSILTHVIAARSLGSYRRRLRWRNAGTVLARGDWRKLASALRRPRSTMREAGG
jgi:hypothetical protein